MVYKKQFSAERVNVILLAMPKLTSLNAICRLFLITQTFFFLYAMFITYIVSKYSKVEHEREHDG